MIHVNGDILPVAGQRAVSLLIVFHSNENTTLLFPLKGESFRPGTKISLNFRLATHL